MLRYLMMTLWSLSELIGPVGRVNSGYQPPSQPPRPAGSSAGEPSPLAWMTLALAIASWFLLPLLAGIAGAIIGWVELKNIKTGQSSEAGKTITQVGFWISVVNVALFGLGTCVFVAVWGIMMGGMAVLFGSIAAAAG